MEVEELVMQGESISSILCTSSMDKISQECKKEPYKYRNEVEIPKLGFVDDMIDVQVCGEKSKELNEYTNEEINKRRLQCHRDKCHRMNIGKEKECQSLFIESWMEENTYVDGKVVLNDIHEGKTSINTTDEQLYLGEILASNGSNEKNIQAKIAKGKGVINEIIFILNNAHFGSYHFQAFMLMRDSLFISVITNQSEVWINTTEKDLTHLETLDANLISRALQSNSKTSKCIMLLELGLKPIRFYIMQKRMMYLHKLLTKGKNTLASKVLHSQMKIH